MNERTYQNLAEYFANEPETQEAFAARVPCAPSMVSMVVNGHRQPTLRMGLRIAECARIPVESLLLDDRAA